ncbi:MAG TPA: HRDC domain-containing protein, partial [Trueperaceae bacterium]|nr:HRDC domain-containing protein [Trueperaceae bacterium]
LIDVLLGHATERVQSLGHDRLSTFGIGTELDERAWRSVARQLLANGQLLPDPDGFGGLVLGPGAAAVLRGEVSVELRRDRERAKPSTRRQRGRGLAGGAPGSSSFASADSTDAAGPAEEALFQALRALRLEIAREQGVPPYVVFHDKTLREMVASEPRSLAELALVPGIGVAKLERYGERFLELLVSHR